MWDVTRPIFSLDFLQKKLYNNYNKKRKEQKNVKGTNFNFYYSKCSKCHNPNNKISCYNKMRQSERKYYKCNRFRIVYRCGSVYCMRTAVVV